MGEQRAVVIGAGIAGVLTARILSERFASVTLLERDEAGENSSLRRGIPQGQHVHNVLWQGVQIIADLFPGFFGEEFRAVGSPGIEVAQSQRFLGPFGWNPVYSTGLVLQGMSRHFLDQQLLRRIVQVPRVELVRGAEVLGLLYDARANRVRGVQTRDPRGVTTSLAADLVVDASGRNSRLLPWLREIGQGVPPTRTVKMTEGYASRSFIYKGRPPAWGQLAILRVPGLRPRGAYLMALEQDRWMVTLVGGDNDYPPATEAEFNAFAASLPVRAVSDLIRASVPDGPIHVFRKMDCVCRHLDRVENWPSGLIVVGDSLCAFNPVFGQGIATAAVGARHLQALLPERATPGWERRFHEGLITHLAAPWFYSVRDDIREGVGAQDAPCWQMAWRALIDFGRSHRRAFRLRALRLLFRAMPLSPAVHFEVFRAQALVTPLSRLFRPVLLLRAIWALRFAKHPSPLDIERTQQFSKDDMKSQSIEREMRVS